MSSGLRGHSVTLTLTFTAFLRESFSLENDIQIRWNDSRIRKHYDDDDENRETRKMMKIELMITFTQQK